MDAEAMSNRVNYATLLSQIGLNSRDFPQEKFVEKHPVWVVLPKPEAMVHGHEGWEITKVSNDLYAIEIIEKFG
jgi:hypothetical protein